MIGAPERQPVCNDNRVDQWQSIIIQGSIDSSVDAPRPLQSINNTSGLHYFEIL